MNILAIKRRLKSEEGKEKVEALQELVSFPWKPTEAILNGRTGNHLSSDSVFKRMELLRRNEQAILDRETLKLVENLTKEHDISVAFWARKAFQVIKGIPTIEKIQEGMNQSILLNEVNEGNWANISLEVLQRVCEIRTSEALSILLLHLSSCQDPVKIAFLVKTIPKNFPTEEVLPFIFPYLKHSNDRVVENALEGVSTINTPKALIELAHLLDHKSLKIQDAAANALRRIDFENTFEIVSAMLQARDRKHLVISGCHVARIWKRTEFLPMLARLLVDDFFFADALKAIEAIGSKEAVQVLEEQRQFSVDEDRNQLIGEVIERAIERSAAEEHPDGKTQKSSM